ncbi:MAG: hypothetical protein QOE22_283 [Candidatus Parcubacteria bacterium]|jgi:hypothetical protein|nr:hypothetical protein [Candidatus Parcubacteria bacterium]
MTFAYMGPKAAIVTLVLLLFVVGVAAYFFTQSDPTDTETKVPTTSFEECQAAGYPIMETYPEQCRTPEGKTFVRDIAEESEERRGQRTACTADAMQCPDGSYVGRTGPNCQFICPSIGGGIEGTVLSGPQCPVLRNPPEPGCDDKPYQGSFALTTPDGNRVIKTFSSDTHGRFRVSAAPGTYRIRGSDAAEVFPNCSSEIITVRAGAYTEADVSCDTGIR